MRPAEVIPQPAAFAVDRVLGWAAGCGVLVGIALLPQLLPGYLNLGIALLVLVGWATAWDVLGGWTGQVSLGHAAFVGLGAYTLGLGANTYRMPPWVSAPVAVLLAVGLAWAWGRVTFRLRGPYFTLSTIAVAEILRLGAINERWLTGGGEGIFVRELARPLGLDLFDRHVQYYWALLYAACAVALVAYLAPRRFGYQMRAVREDEEAAQAAGVDPVAVKLRAFMLSAGLVAFGGVLYGAYLSALVPHALFDLRLSVQIALTAIIGGRGTVWGPAVGAVLIVLAAELFRNLFASANLLIYGLLIVLVVLFAPRGIVGQWERWRVRRRYARSVAGR